MKIYLKDLANIADQKVYPITIAEKNVNDSLFLRGIKNVEGEISFYYDYEDKLWIDYQLQGSMICPDAFTLEDVEVPFDLAESEPVVFKETEEGFYLSGNIEADELALLIIAPEAPIKVVKSEKIEYSRGDDWSVMSEEAFEKASKDAIDPRLAKLKDFKFDEED